MFFVCSCSVYLCLFPCGASYFAFENGGSKVREEGTTGESYLFSNKQEHRQRQVGALVRSERRSSEAARFPTFLLACIAPAPASFSRRIYREFSVLLSSMHSHACQVVQTCTIWCLIHVGFFVTTCQSCVKVPRHVFNALIYGRNLKICKFFFS